MRGREFLDVARELQFGAAEAHFRGAVVHAYYALLLECREALTRWGAAVPPRQNVHSFVRLTLLYARDTDLKTLGKALDFLAGRRNQASYDLGPLPDFRTRRLALRCVQYAADLLALLDAVEADPARRAAAAAALPPP